MKKLFLILLLVFCSNFVTKAWCVLCVRERSAVQLLTEEANHHIFTEPEKYDHDRTMTETYYTDNECLEKDKTYFFHEWHDQEGHFEYKVDNRTVTASDFFHAKDKSTETTDNVICANPVGRAIDEKEL